MISKTVLRILAGTAVLSTGVALAGCAGSSSEGSGDGPVTIQYWGWVPGVQALVDEWNAANPDIQVEYSEQSGGNDDTFSKITTAATAGDAPDLVQADVKWVTGLLPYAKDVTAEAAQYESNFTSGAWSNVTLDGVTYGLPQDSGPMVMYYNKAKFEQLGLEVPQTWDEFSAAAKKVASENPGTFLAGFSSDDLENFQSFVQQAGGQWYTIGGDAWNIDVTGTASEKVAAYWQDLIDADAVSATKRWDPSFYNELANGQILSVVGAAWQAQLIADNAQSLSGDWAVATAPQWTAGETVSANNGGSQLLVMEGTEHAAQALEFANWLNTNTEGLTGLGLFPATADATLTTPDSLKTFFGGQDIYADLSEAANNIDTQWLFPPVYSTIGPKLSDGIAAVRNGTTTLPQVLEQIQAESLTAFEAAGINATAD